MKKVIKIIIILLIVLALSIACASNIYTNDINCDENTLIVSVCTGNMRALETGVSVYAGFNKRPLILSDKTLPEQLDKWLPGYVQENNITKIIIVGPVTAQQLLNFMKLNVEVKQVNGDSIADILTKIAYNNNQINKKSIILTGSDPLAGVLGAYTKTPVFITASNSTYQSGDLLEEKYLKYIEKNDINHVIIVGNLPETIKSQLQEYDVTIEELSGENSLEVSNSVNNKLIKEGYVNNTTTAYYGFFGELPTIVPSIIKNNAIMIEDSSNNGDVTSYLKNNSISTVYITRNTESDYIQMEETDYISTNVINKLTENKINIKYLTKRRTLDEATGLYDTKIITAEEMQNKTQTLNSNLLGMEKTQPPLLEMLNEKNCIDSNNISATITGKNDEFTVKWSTIHPYTWKKIDKDHYYATSNTGYEYYWTKKDNSWNVDYKYNNTTYYNITWKENPDYSWIEQHQFHYFTWKYNGNQWNCYDENGDLVYYITHNSKNV